MASTRLLWTSAKAREVWEPRIRAVADAWLTVELASVTAGLRGAALVFGEPRWRAQGLPGRSVGGDRWAVGPLGPELAERLLTGDDEGVGRVLNFPQCCREFFHRVRVPGDVDTTAAMAWRGTEGPVEANILGRWLGVRTVPHLPCSFTCEATVASARRFAPLWPEQELAWAREILSWPVEWSAAHGVAEVKYPVLKLVTPTTVADRAVVQRHGRTYPDEGARGIAFPYLHPRAWRDNGFASYEGMRGAHEMVLAALRASPPRGRVLDLGAGNGQLLDAVSRTFGVPVQGVEAIPARAAAHADVVCGDLLNLPDLPLEPWDTAVVSVRRFEELPHLESWIRHESRQVCVYSYDDMMFARVGPCTSNSKTPATCGSPTVAG